MNFHKILWTNGIILDVENNKEYDWLMTRNESIFAMGNDEDRSEEYDEVFDLEGKVLMSAFIKSHGCFSKDVFSYIQPNLSNCKSFKDIKHTIEKFVKDNNIKADQWITASGYDNNKLKEKAHPTKDYLDLISKTNPIVIIHQSGHAGVFNTVALEHLKTDVKTAAPADGYLEECAFTNTIKKIPLRSDDYIIEAIIKAQDHYFSQGITLAQEGMMTKDLIFLYKVILDRLDLGLDIVYYVKDDDIETVLRAFGDTETLYNKNLKYGGIYLPLTKKVEYNKTDIIETDIKELNNFVIETSFDQEIYDGLKLVSDFKVSPLVSINSHSGITQFINTIEKLKSIGFDLTQYRPILITSQVLDNEQVKRIKDLNIIVSFTISDKNVTSNIGSQKDALEKGLMFTIHQSKIKFGTR